MALTRIVGGFFSLALAGGVFMPPQPSVAQSPGRLISALPTGLDVALLNESLIEAESRYGLGRHLLLAVALAESALNPRAVSPVGARGLMQVMPDTAQAVWPAFVATLPAHDPIRRLKPKQDLFHVRYNVLLGSFYLSEMIKRFDGSLNLALAAYNYGPYKIETMLKQAPLNQPRRLLARSYVTRIHGHLRELSGIAQFERKI